MFKVLLGNRMRALFGSMLGRGSRRKKKTSVGQTVLFALLMVYVAVVFLGMFGMIFGQMVVPYHELGLDWMYFVMVAIMSFTLMVIGSIFMTKSQLYEARDNELLLSMPVKPSAILASRMAMLLIFELIFEILVAAPAVFVWLRHYTPSVAGVLGFALIFLALPFFALAVSGIFGALLAALSSRVRNKTVFTMVFSLAFLGVYFYFCSQMYRYVEQLAVNGQLIANTLGGVQPLVWIGRGVTGSLADLALSLVVLLVPFVLVYWLLSCTFLRIATAKRGFAKIEYKAKALKVSDVRSALFQKELKRFTSCPGYMMNGGLGVVFVAALGVLALLKTDVVKQIAAQMQGYTGILPVIAILALCLMNSMIIISASSVSLEGTRLWILQSLPVSTQDILYAKTKVHCIVALPAMLFASAALAVAVRADALGWLFLLLIPSLNTVLCAELGLIVNLRHPKFDWISEMQAVKQGVSVLLAMLYTFLIVLVPGLVYFLWLGGRVSSTLFLLGLLVLHVAGLVAAQKWLTGRGCRVFENLNA